MKNKRATFKIRFFIRRSQQKTQAVKEAGHVTEVCFDPLVDVRIGKNGFSKRFSLRREFGAESNNHMQKTFCPSF